MKTTETDGHESGVSVKKLKIFASVGLGAFLGRLVAEGLYTLREAAGHASVLVIPFFFLGSGVDVWVHPFLQAPILDYFSLAVAYSVLGGLIAYTPFAEDRRRYLRNLGIGLIVYCVASYLLLGLVSSSERLNPDLRLP
jgi:hypothetical protein